MASTYRHQRHIRRLDVRRRIVTALVTVAMGVTTALTATQPAAAATPWLSVSDGFASFTVPADDIQNTMGNVSGVVVEGTFGPSFNVSELGLVRSGNAWTIVIGPLPAGLYHYRLRGDDTKIVKDPTNPATVTSDPTWSTFFIPGDSVRLLTDVPAGQGGTIGTVTYPSSAANQERTATVWTPPGYDARRAEPYPVLYLLQGEAGGHTDWIDLGRAKQILDNLAGQDRTRPMVVVIGDGNAPDFEQDLTNIARVARRQYNIARDAAHQALAGVSAAGSQVLRTALAHPGEYAYVGSFAGLGLSDDFRVNGRAVNAGTKLLRLYTGNMTDPAYNPTLRWLRTLDRAGVRHEFDGVNPDVGHNWKAWQENLADFAPRLFRPVRDHRPSPGHLPLSREFQTPPSGTPTPWLTRAANGDAFVTVETGTEFADAEHITLWGNWAPGGSWVNVPFTRHGDRWRVTVGPLKPWFYYYRLMIDTVATKDPASPTRVTSDPTLSTFLVPGRASRLLTDVPAGRGGTVETLTYTSNVAGAERAAYVWTPPGYNPRRAAPYPVLYLQHGGGQNYTDWVEMGRAKQILDRQYLDGTLVPMVVVMGNGNVSDFTKELLENIVPAARAAYNISHEPAQQALAGLSMGGFQAFDVLRTHPGEFAYIGTFSAGIFNSTGFDAAAVNSGTKLLRVYTGNVTDFVYPFVMSTLTTLDTLGIRYDFAGITPGPHGWDAWQKNLIDFAPRLFRNDAG